MTDTAPIDPNAVTDLGTFEGLPILDITVAITKAGDGLSNALKANPHRFPKGSRTLLLLEVEAGAVAHKPAKDADAWIEVRTLEAVGVAFVPKTLAPEVTRLITETNERVKEAIERERGVNRLPVGEAFAKAHDAGDHASGLVPGCPTCQEEADAMADEAGDNWPTTSTAGTPEADAPPPPPTNLAGRRRPGKAEAAG